MKGITIIKIWAEFSKNNNNNSNILNNTSILPNYSMDLQKSELILDSFEFESTSRTTYIEIF